MATLKQRLHRKNGSSYDVIHLESDATVVHMSPTDDTTLSTKINNIDTEMNSVKTSVSNGKSLIASAITDKGVSTASDATFQVMADNISQIKSGVSVPVFGENFNYTGEYQILSDGDDNWRIKFLTSGTFTPLDNMAVDVFLCGGGGGGLKNYSKSGSFSYLGGGGGYTKTVKSIVLTNNIEYQIIIGDGGIGANINRNDPITNYPQPGGSSSAFNISVNGGGGASGSAISCGSGGSGGGWTSGGTDGSDGVVPSGAYPSAGKGQGSTTREFGESTGTLYSTGGSNRQNKNKDPNTGDGGDGSSFGGFSGGSGIVIIRNAR